MIGKNLFREDLFYRLNVIPIRLPPLRERLEDLPLLIEHLLEENRLKTGKAIHDISQEAMETLLRYHWPGNIRELINTLRLCLRGVQNELHRGSEPSRDHIR